MAHKFDGTWTLKTIAERGVPPSRPNAGGDTILAINNAGVIDPALSFMDGRPVLQGSANGTTIDVFTTDGRHYSGHLIHPAIVASQPIFTIAGRFGPGRPTPLASSAPEPKGATATKGKATNTARAAAAAAAQDQGGWVMTKP